MCFHSLGPVVEEFNLGQNDADLEIGNTLCHFFKATLDWIALIQIQTFQDH